MRPLTDKELRDGLDGLDPEVVGWPVARANAEMLDGLFTDKSATDDNEEGETDD